MDLHIADLCDENPERVSVCEPLFTSYGGRESFYGVVATVRVFEDNTLVREALESVPAGSVLVVDGGASRRCALIGDKLASIAVSRGLAGVIVNGAVRDSRETATLDIGVLALASNPRRSAKGGAGERDVPLAFGGVSWEPGHHVYVDEDGVILSSEPLL